MPAVIATHGQVAGVPATLWYQYGVTPDATDGTVLFYHGFGGDRQRVSGYAEAIADAGLLCIALDAVGHGERRLRDFDTVFSDERWDTCFEDTEADFLQLIDDTAAEIPSIIEELLRTGLARPGRIGVGGRSLGGNVSYAAILADRRLAAMASVVGSPQWTLPREHSPHLHASQFYPAAVLSEAAGNDEHCPAAEIRQFHQELRPWYAAQPDRLQYVEHAETGHFLSPELNAQSCARTAAWFRRWLAAGM